jgi:predicted RNase H-like HicB family nuclease
VQDDEVEPLSAIDRLAILGGLAADLKFPSIACREPDGTFSVEVVGTFGDAVGAGATLEEARQHCLDALAILIPDLPPGVRLAL